MARGKNTVGNFKFTEQNIIAFSSCLGYYDVMQNRVSYAEKPSNLKHKTFSSIQPFDILY